MRDKDTKILRFCFLFVFFHVTDFTELSFERKAANWRLANPPTFLIASAIPSITFPRRARESMRGQ